ncbi:MAG TPA: DUF4332 domain-containing protein [Candidatus Nanoarchaeia archaeon]|nr:DUF4332 domain-containing protein [Candidatus Nanoarchaeia archaeon]
MRLDLPLYGVAIVILALAVVVFVQVSADDGQLVYTISMIVLGLLVAATGYVVRPKASVPVEPVTMPNQPVDAPIKQTPPVDAQTISAANVETPVVEAPAAPATIVETSNDEIPSKQPKPEAAPTPEVMAPAPDSTPSMQVDSVTPKPVLTAPEPSPQLSAPAETPALEAAVVPIAMSHLTAIRGINAKRAEQLNAIGINTIEDLAKASPEDLAAKLMVSPRIVKMWVGSAKKQIK